MTIRQQVADQIKADNAAYIVKAYAASAPDNLGAGKVAISVWRSDLKPVLNQPNILEHDVTIHVMCASGAGSKAYDSADDALDEVLLSLERIPGVELVQATAQVFSEKFLGWEITATAHSTNVYRSTVLKEG